MKYEAIPITPKVITWARTRAGISIDDAKKKFRKIESWESEEGVFPSYPQVEQMAEAFKVPIAVFFFPSPPDLPSISETFRTLPESEFDQISTRMRYLLRRAKAYQISLEELADGRNPAGRVITRGLDINLDASITSIAMQVRKYIDISMETQRSWANTDGALKEWRKALQGVGVAVFKDAFLDKTNNYFGFCLYDAEFPLIYVNNSMAKARQIFTLFHELAHLLFETSGIDGLTDEVINQLPKNDRKIEVICNRFASEFLVPEKTFDVAFKGMPATEESANQLADEFNVSRTFVYLRFLKRGLISQDVYSTAANKWNQERIAAKERAKQKAKEAKKGTGDYYNNIMTYRDGEYMRLAFTQYFQNRIDEIQLADYLDVKPRAISTLENYFVRSVAE